MSVIETLRSSIRAGEIVTIVYYGVSVVAYQTRLWTKAC
jgi:hypothetical protein